MNLKLICHIYLKTEYLLNGNSLRRMLINKYSIFRMYASLILTA